MGKYTSKNQSMKLIKLGLNVNSSDFHWFNYPEGTNEWIICKGNEKYILEQFHTDPNRNLNISNKRVVPSWSFDRLLNLMSEGSINNEELISYIKTIIK